MAGESRPPHAIDYINNGKTVQSSLKSGNVSHCLLCSCNPPLNRRLVNLPRENELGDDENLSRPAYFRRCCHWRAAKNQHAGAAACVEGASSSSSRTCASSEVGGASRGALSVVCGDETRGPDGHDENQTWVYPFVRGLDDKSTLVKEVYVKPNR
jgi:hypothetical protein